MTEITGSTIRPTSFGNGSLIQKKAEWKLKHYGKLDRDRRETGLIMNITARELLQGLGCFDFIITNLKAKKAAKFGRWQAIESVFNSLWYEVAGDIAAATGRNQIVYEKVLLREIERASVEVYGDVVITFDKMLSSHRA